MNGPHYLSDLTKVAWLVVLPCLLSMHGVKSLQPLLWLLLHAGLDSFAALSVMGHLQHVAQETHQTVIATIHQPRSAIWEMFDSVSSKAAAAGSRAVCPEGRWLDPMGFCNSSNAHSSSCAIRSVGRHMLLHPLIHVFVSCLLPRGMCCCCTAGQHAGVWPPDVPRQLLQHDPMVPVHRLCLHTR